MIVLVGATGTLGPLLVPLLQAGPEPLRIVTRNPSAAASLHVADVVSANVCDPADARRAVAGARVVISAMSGFASPAGVEAVDAAGNAVLFAAAREAGAEHIILVSVAHAAADHPIPLFRAKFAAEQSLRASGVPWTIVRPTAYLETWLGLVGGPLLATGKTTVFGRGRNPINFVSALDVARVIASAVRDPQMRGRTIETPGPDNLTLDQLVAIAAEIAGRPLRASHAPRPILRILSVALRPINRMRADQVATALAMDTLDMAVDGRRIRAAGPDVPLTTATEVAARLFGPSSASGAATRPI